MITSLAQNITGYLLKNKIIENSKMDIYIYGFEIMISNILCLAICLFFGVIFSQLFEAVVFLSVFMLMRKYCGGYHADTYFTCNATFVLNMFIVMTILKIISHYAIYAHIAVICISFMSAVLLAPIENQYKPLTQNDIKKHKQTAIVLSLCIGIVSTILYFTIIQYAVMIDMALVTVAVFMIIEIIRKGHECREKCQKSIS